MQVIAPLPFDRSQQLYLLKPGVAPEAAVHPERFHADRRQQDGQRDEPARPDGDAWQELPRADLLDGLFQERRLDRVALTTDAGLGKSYNLQWLRHELNDRARRQRAFLLPIGGLVSAPDLIPDVLVPLVRAAPGNEHECRIRLQADLERLRHRGQLTLLFDGLDMALDASVECLAQLLEPRGPWGRCRIVVAGRPFALERHWQRLFAGKPWQFVQIAEFTSAQQRRALGKLPGGRERYEGIPREARNILTIPRVLEYLRPLDEAALDRLHTVADVYWQATGYMLRQALGTNVDVWSWEEFLAILGALAFTMYAETETHAETGELRPNLDRIAAPDMPQFLRNVLGRLATALPAYGKEDLKKALPELSRLNAVLNHGWFDVSNVGGVGEDLLWRNASLQEFYAAYWATCWGTDTDRQHLRGWLVDPLKEANTGFYWFWRYAAEMPDDAIQPGSKKPPVAWQAAMTPLYDGSVVDDQGRPIRSTEFLYRSWDRMAGTPAQVAFLQEFPLILDGQKGGEKQQIAARMLDGFIPLVGSGRPGDTGTFIMGAPPDEAPTWDQGDNPQHEVTLTPYRLHRFCVTNDEYELFDGRHAGRRWWGDEQHPLVKNARGKKKQAADQRCPVVNVSWYDSWCFAIWCGCELPTEAQWEYACRAGRETPFTFGGGHDGRTCTADVCNFDGNYPFGEGAKEGKCRQNTIPVDELPPNFWGFHQMHGNVWEWCADWYAANYYHTADGNLPNPCNGASATARVLRGGCWFYGGRSCRSASRDRRAPAYRVIRIGFRLAAVPVRGAKTVEKGKRRQGSRSK